MNAIDRESTMSRAGEAKEEEEEEYLVYRNPSEPVEARVSDLLSRMSLREKLGQMTQIDRSVADSAAIRDLCIGSVLNGGGSDGDAMNRASAADWADMIDAFQNSALQSRLGIPIVYAVDAVHGHSNVYGATIFPHHVALGATSLAFLLISSLHLTSLNSNS